MPFEVPINYSQYMDSSQILAVAGVAAGVVGALIAWLQLRRTPRLPSATHLADLGTQTSPVPRSPLVGIVLRPPTGRIPDHVWGREEIIHQLTTLTQQPDGRAHLLAGLGGCGKTTVALAIAEQVLRRNQPAWWISAADQDSLTSQFLQLAGLLGAVPGEVDEALAGRRSPADLLWHVLESHSGWLIVIDNADDPAVLALDQHPAGDGSAWIRPSYAGLMLLTSRTGDPITWGRHVEVHSVGWLNEADGGSALQSLAPLAGTNEEAAILSARLGGLPLAIHHAGLHLASPFARESTFDDYRQALEHSFPQLMSAGADDRSMVTRTWRLSLDQLAAKDIRQSHALLLSLACFAPATPIPRFVLDYKILSRLCSDRRHEEVAQGLEALHSVGLIELRASDASPKTSDVVVHPLVRETILHDSKSFDDSKTAFGVAVELLDGAVNSLSPGIPDHWPLWLLLVPHSYSLLGSPLLPELSESEIVTLLHAVRVLADALIWTGSYVSSHELTEAALSRSTSGLPEHEETLRLRFVHAMTNLNLRSLVEAETELRAVIKIQREKLGFSHIDTLSSSHELAATLARKGQLIEAETLYREILEEHSKAAFPDRTVEFASRHEFARVLADQGKLDEAESQYKELLDARIPVNGSDHPKTLITRFRVADLAARQGRADDSEKQFAEVLNDSVRVLGPEHPDTLKIRSGLARVLESEGRKTEAENQYEVVLDGRKKVLGNHHPLTLDTQAALNSLRGNSSRTSQ
jgi:tetratricopeptide (TPR) repeat protein